MGGGSDRGKGRGGGGVHSCHRESLAQGLPNTPYRNATSSHDPVSYVETHVLSAESFLRMVFRGSSAHSHPRERTACDSNKLHHDPLRQAFFLSMKHSHIDYLSLDIILPLIYLPFMLYTDMTSIHSDIYCVSLQWSPTSLHAWLACIQI